MTDGPDTGDRPVITTFDAVGNTLTSADETASVTSTSTFTHDLLDEIVAEARGDGSDAKTTYDPAGNPVDRCTWAAGATVGDCLAVGTAGWTNPPTNSTTTRWDARNGRIGLTDAASNRTTVYDPDHGYAVSAVYLPTNIDQTKEHQSLYGYDSRHRLTSISQQLCTISAGHACSATSATGSDTYAYDDADNRTRVAEDNGSSSSDYRYCHDARGQLTGRGSTAACDTSSIETFTFDDAGNRTSALEAGVTRDFAYTAAGLLCDVETGSAASCSGGNIGSDDAGRISDEAGWHFAYDAQARLVSACDDADCIGTGFDRVDFAYDGEGHRTAITETPAAGSPIVETTFRYAGDAIVAEYVDGTLSREYTTDDAGTISKVTIPAGASAGTYLVTWNGHGDALALYRIETSGALTLANSYTYSTWGRPTTATHNSIADLGFRFLYVGAADVQWDDAFGLGLTYMHARHYSPTLGRFLQPDPSRLDAQLFVYAGNGPVSRVDPSGTLFIDHPIAKVERALKAYCFASQARTVICGLAEYARLSAEREMRRRFRGPYNNNRADAFRHCCWSGNMTRIIGSTKAAYISDQLYEMNEPIGTKLQMRLRSMDLYNNRAGRSIGASVQATWRISYLFGVEIARSRAFDVEFRAVSARCWAAAWNGRLRIEPI